MLHENVFDKITSTTSVLERSILDNWGKTSTPRGPSLSSWRYKFGVSVIQTGPWSRGLSDGRDDAGGGCRMNPSARGHFGRVCRTVGSTVRGRVVKLQTERRKTKRCQTLGTPSTFREDVHVSDKW